MTEEKILKDLGSELLAARKRKKKSLEGVAKPAKISTTYLQKLESGKVKSPSPHVLLRLSNVLNFPYVKMMQLAGYIMPDNKKLKSDSKDARIISLLAEEELSESELRAVASFVKYLKEQR